MTCKHFIPVLFPRKKKKGEMRKNKWGKKSNLVCVCVCVCKIINVLFDDHGTESWGYKCVLIVDGKKRDDQEKKKKLKWYVYVQTARALDELNARSSVSIFIRIFIESIFFFSSFSEWNKFYIRYVNRIFAYIWDKILFTTNIYLYTIKNFV